MSTCVDFLVAKKLFKAKEYQKRLWLGLSITSNLGTLALFKYYNFFSASMANLLQGFGMQPDFVTLNVILPVGISFYTFQTLSYTIDVYRGRLRPCTNFIDFALYVSFFPQLVAGPIERAERLLPQIKNRRLVSRKKLESGLWLICIGYVKKLVIADNCGRVVDHAFNPEFAGASGVNTGLATLLFALQIYGDFSGYSDIARGTAKLMGFDLMVNFGRPYLVHRIRDVWSHWHISLSSWLRDYLYIPLGGNRGSTATVYRNLLLTMCLGGLWHGAHWAFILWGLYHGTLLVTEKALCGYVSKNRFTFHRHLALLAVFLLTCVGWFIFRIGGVGGAESGRVAWSMLVNFGGGVGFAAGVLPFAGITLFALLFVVVFQYYWAQMEDFSSWSPFRKGVSTAVTIVSIGIFGYFESSQFIYFQF